MALLPPITHRGRVAPWPLRVAGWVMLKVFGWKLGPGPADIDRGVVLCGSHTSNWDFWFGVGGCWAFGVPCRWLGKSSLFRWPFGGFMRAIGGIPVDRAAAHGLVGQVSEMLRAEPLFVLVPPEGSRSWRPYWKSGFYWIARNSGAPIVLGYLDYAKKEAGFGPVVPATGDVSADMAPIRAFYSTKPALFPACVGPIRLRDEDGAREGA